MNDQQAPTEATATHDAPPTCGAARELVIDEVTLSLKCSRQPEHDEDHFDEQAGLGWFNEGTNTAGMTQEERTHAILDRLGVPRGRDGNAWTLVQRTNLFVDRLSRRLHTQVENNMILYNVCKDARMLLEGAPGASQYRIKAAIEKLRDATTVKRPGSKIILQ